MSNVKTPLKNYIKVQGGNAFKSTSFQEDGIPVIRISNITHKGLQLDGVCVSNDLMNENIAFLAEENDTLIAMSGATTGKSCIVTKRSLPALINQRVGRFIVNSLMDKLYLHQLINTPSFQNEISINAIGGAQPNISSKQIENISLYIEDDINTQRHIAEILSTADTLITQTEAVIAKYKSIKQGMLHDLFTRGIDVSTGKLRPTPQQAPHLYKESVLGLIPREWEVKRLEEIGDFKNGINKDKNAFGTGTLFVNITDSYKDKLEISQLGRVLISESEKQDYKLINGDIIFVRSSVKPDGVGYNTLFEYCDEVVVFCGFMIRFRISDINIYVPRFYNSYLRQDNFRKRLIAISTVSANTNINQVALRSLFVVKPDEIEQNKAADKLKGIEDKINSEMALLSKYQSIKKGLMKRLLEPEGV